LSKADYSLFHSPYTKLVQKSYSRLAYQDFLSHDSSPKFATVNKELKSVGTEASYEHKEIGKVFDDLTKEERKAKVDPSLLLPKALGNTYTASLYTSLLSLVSAKQDDLVNCY
jgi:hydroxymethylglutaryl-CoA synthase